MPDTPHNAPANHGLQSHHPEPGSVEGIFLAALTRDSSAARAAFLDTACNGDAAKRRRVEALLAAWADAGSFLESPPAGLATEACADSDLLAPADDPALLGRLGDYEVIERIGRGGMGIVFRARDPGLNRIVAMKVLAPELAAHPAARRRFLREAQAAAAISHPHVVTIHAVEDRANATPPLPFLVMECVVGQTLQDKIDRQGPLRVTEILRIGQQIADGLAAAHRQGLIHRDIKPANILLENGVERVRITDFGLARAADDASISRTGEVSGTPQYMSPEQAAGERIDHRSDLFSLGCVLYAMCTGRSPFQARHAAAAIQRVCQDDTRPVADVNPEIPDRLAAIVDRLLLKDADARPQSAADVAAELGDFLAERQQPGLVPRANGTHARRPGPSHSAEPRRTSHAHAVAERRAGWDHRGLCAALIVMSVPTLVFLLSAWIPAVPGNIRTVEAGVMALLVAVPVGIGLLAISMPLSEPAWAPWFLALCVLLGPIGILLYLVRRHELDPGLGGTRRQSPDQLESRRGGTGQRRPAPLPSPATERESSAGVTGRYLMQFGVLLMVWPVGLIAGGALTGDGDPMELGGSALVLGTPVGVLAIILGALVRRFMDEHRSQQTPLRLWRGALSGLLVASVVILIQILKTQGVIPS